MTPELKHRITQMGRRWGYSVAELAEAYRNARADPEAWQRVVDWDESKRTPHETGSEKTRDTDEYEEKTSDTV